MPQDAAECGRKNRTGAKQNGDVRNIRITYTANKKILINGVSKNPQHQQPPQFFFIHWIFEYFPVQYQHGQRCNYESQAIKNGRMKMTQSYFDNRNVRSPKTYHQEKQEIDYGKLKFHPSTIRNRKLTSFVSTMQYGSVLKYSW